MKKTFEVMSSPKGVKKLVEILLTAPAALWLIVFFLVPTILIFAVCFHPADHTGGIGDGWTLDTIKNVLSSNYMMILWRTIWVSAISTALCLVIALPVGYYIASVPKKWRPWLLLLTVLPLWTNFLVRIFAWRLVLHPDGTLRKIFLTLGMPEDVYLLNNVGAVIVVTVYTFLPFAILPIYAAAEKFNFSLLEAARDLGETRFGAFTKIFIPGIRKGIITAFLIVFVPALGSYAIPDLVGGVKNELIGNNIALRAMSSRNLPEAASYAAILAVVILAPLLAFFAFNRKNLKNLIKAMTGEG
jgi:spermidine/putrescine transport system permease protein